MNTLVHFVRATTTLEAAQTAAQTVSASAAATSTTAVVHSARDKVGDTLVLLTDYWRDSSCFFIGSSFVIKKKGLLNARHKHTHVVAGEGHAYLKDFIWWIGMICMVVGELLNFAAYAFVPAVVVTPMGALSVVVCAVLSRFFLKETLTLFGWLGCTLCILGAIILALNGPEEQSVTTIVQFKALFLAPGFLVFGSIIIASVVALILFVVPKFGKKYMLVHISICSLIGGLSVACTQGLGAAILTSIRGNNQFKNWFTYFTLVFVVVTLLTEINYLNKALELFNTSLVTPTYYVSFTGCVLVTSIVLFQGLKASVLDIITMCLSFLVIGVGITVLQLSKVDPETLVDMKQVDEKSTLLMNAARSEVGHQTADEHLMAAEDPGVDSVGMPGGGILGSLHRARRASRRMSENSNGSSRAPLPLSGLRKRRSSGSLGGQSSLHSALYAHREDDLGSHHLSPQSRARAQSLRVLEDGSRSHRFRARSPAIDEEPYPDESTAGPSRQVAEGYSTTFMPHPITYPSNFIHQTTSPIETHFTSRSITSPTHENIMRTRRSPSTSPRKASMGIRPKHGKGAQNSEREDTVRLMDSRQEHERRYIPSEHEDDMAFSSSPIELEPIQSTRDYI